MLLTGYFSFIKHADFILKPVTYYYNDLFYIWRDFNSTPNPDGIMRMPFRLPYLLTNGFLGPDITAYIYLLSIILFSFFSMYWFIRTFIVATNRSFIILSALFFAINPIFLGNLSKVGLQLGVACLPLALVSVRKYLDSKDKIWILPTILLLLMSLVHPFTFIINLIVLVGYMLLEFKRLNWRQIAISGLVAVGLGAYIWLPLLSLGSVSRSQLETGGIESDPASLIDVANTDGLVEGLTLSKSVLVDFPVYNSFYQPIYTISVLMGLAVILVALFLPTKADLYRRWLILCLGIFAVLVVLADVSTEQIRSLLIWVVNTPLGWAFRSPLKWQLYMPVVLSIALAVALSIYPKKTARIAVYVVAASMFLMNAFVSLNVAKDLLRPKSIKAFSSLAAEDLSESRVLFLRDFGCGRFLTKNHTTDSELQYILQTSNLQTTYVLESDLPNVSVTDYDYIIDCTNFEFKDMDSWQLLSTDSGIVKVFKTNYSSVGLAETAAYGWQGLGIDITEFAGMFGEFDKSRVVILDEETAANGELHEVFSLLDKNGFTAGGSINTEIALSGKYQNVRLLSATDEVDLKISSISDTSLDDVGFEGAPLGNEGPFSVSFSSPNYQFENQIVNGSLEEGLWQERVGDCYNFDANPVISMDQSNDAVDGLRSLELSATRHIACTNTADPIAVIPGGNIFVSFQRKVEDGDRYRYAFKFNDSEGSLVERSEHVQQLGIWELVTEIIPVPDTATAMTIIVYATPSLQGHDTSTVIYDDFFATSVPDISNKYYLIASDDGGQTNLVSETVRSNPTSYSITLDNDQLYSETYLVLKEQFHPGWMVTALNGEAATDESVTAHVSDLNGYNVWKLNGLDGYGETVVIEVNFSPQRSFQIGLIISSLTLITYSSYLVYDNLRTGAKYSYNRKSFHGITGK